MSLPLPLFAVTLAKLKLADANLTANPSFSHALKVRKPDGACRLCCSLSNDLSLKVHVADVH